MGIIIGMAMATFFLVVTSAVGFMSIYDQIEAGTQRRVNTQRSLSVFQTRYPTIIYLCSVLIALRVIDALMPASLPLYWMVLNIQLIILLYTNLLVKSLTEFAIVQAVGAVMFMTTGDMTVYNGLIFLAACLLIYGERWYGSRLFGNRRALYWLPPLLVGGVFWGLMGRMHTQYLNWTQVAVFYLALVWSYVALSEYDRWQSRDRQMLAQLKHDVQYDGLTGARNWATFQSDFNHAFENKQSELGIITFDVDHFKTINDQYGHLTGNHVLMTIAAHVTAHLSAQAADANFYRTGGEEFAVLVPNANRAQMRVLTRSCRALINGLNVQHDTRQLKLTASFGAALANEQDMTATGLFKRADQYLYAVKNNGRDGVVVEGERLY